MQISFQMFLSQQVKRKVIITYENGKYELTAEFPNDVRTPWNYKLVPGLLHKMKILSILARNY